MSATALAAALLAQAVAPDLTWLAGYWLSCERGREVSETWSGPRDGLMLGASFAGDEWEQLRIGPSKDGYSYFAQPSGQAPAEFPLASSTPGRAVFENPAHDFPQRITYARDGAGLTARIEGTMNGQTRAMQWRYVAAPLNARCGEDGQSG